MRKYSMLKKERQQEIEQILNSRKRISIRELASLTYSSTSTLRRDLIYLEENGFLKRNKGEVILNSLNAIERSHNIRKAENQPEKKYIAGLAKDFIAPGMCIYLDSSTTVYELCPYICDIDNLIVFTNGLNIAQRLSELANSTIKIFIAQGEVKHHSSSIISYNVENALLNHFRVDLAFCSAHGIDHQFVYEASLSQALSKKSIIDYANESILLIDHSKFYQTGFFKINALSKYKTIISDALPNEQILESCELSGIEWCS